MRVIAGSARGRPLRCLDDKRVRPTLDRVKEAVFSSLTPRLPGSRVLDLFAGSGALGIEALSRGAGAAVFLEIDQQACDMIKHNLSSCGWPLSEDVVVVHREAVRWLKSQASKAAPAYDIILADPPYSRGFEESVLRAIAGSGLLAAEGILVLESDRRQPLPASMGALCLSREKTYGDSKISYYTYLGQSPI